MVIRLAKKGSLEDFVGCISSESANKLSDALEVFRRERGKAWSESMEEMTGRNSSDCGLLFHHRPHTREPLCPEEAGGDSEESPASVHHSSHRDGAGSGRRTGCPAGGRTEESR